MQTVRPGWAMVRSGQGSLRARAKWTGHLDRGDGMSRCGKVALFGRGVHMDREGMQGIKHYCRRCEALAANTED